MNPDEKSHKRALNVIAAYGAEQSAWPEEERGATLDALQSSDQLTEMLSEAASLDSLLQRSARVGDIGRSLPRTADCASRATAVNAIAATQ
jgi:hypothetical protein